MNESQDVATQHCDSTGHVRSIGNLSITQLLLSMELIEALRPARFLLSLKSFQLAVRNLNQSRYLILMAGLCIAPTDTRPFD